MRLLSTESLKLTYCKPSALILNWMLVRLFSIGTCWFAGVLFFFVASAVAQNTTPIPLTGMRSWPTSTDATAAELTQADRIQFALDLALTAATADMAELSLEAVRRAAKQQWVAAAPLFHSSILGGVPQSPVIGPIRIVNGVAVQVTTMTSVQTNAKASSDLTFSKRLLAIVDVWKTKQVAPDKIAAALKPAILPAGNSNAVNLYAESDSRDSRAGITTMDPKAPVQLPRTLASEFLEAAVAGGQDSVLAEELRTRAGHPSAALNATAMLVMHKRLKDGFQASVDQLVEYRRNSVFNSAAASEILISALFTVSEQHGEPMLAEQLPFDALKQLTSNFPSSQTLWMIVFVRLHKAAIGGDVDLVKRELELLECVTRSGDQTNSESFNRLRKRMLEEGIELATKHNHAELAELLKNR